MRSILFFAALALATASCRSQGKTLKVGDPCPVFTLQDENGQPFKVQDYLGKKILVIYFYPKDESPVCTREACAFRDEYTAFAQQGAIVIGINQASVESHHSFVSNHQLPFTLLSDTGKHVLDLFGVKGTLIGTGRETFVVDLHGKIVYAFNSMLQGKGHVDKALAFIRQMNAAK